MTKRKKAPHCASSWHFQHCICHHERQYHNEESGHCLERKCECEVFRLGSQYQIIEHVYLR